MRLIRLSYSLDGASPLYGSTPKPQIKCINSIEGGDSSNGYLITIANHSGTHVDAPAHFVKGGKPICDYKLEDLIFSKPKILEIKKKAGEWIEHNDLEGRIPEDCDCVLIRTGFWEKRNTAEYKENNPGIAPEAIKYLRENCKAVRCIGIDSLSISGFQDRPRGRVAHAIAFEEGEGLGDPILLIEDMDLSKVEESSVLDSIMVVPWEIKGIDSAPCTVIAKGGR